MLVSYAILAGRPKQPHRSPAAGAGAGAEHDTRSACRLTSTGEE